MEDVTLKLDPLNIEHYNKFSNQTRDPRVAVYDGDEIFFGVYDIKPELYNPQGENVKFDKFEEVFGEAEKFVQKLKESLQNFEESDNSVFDLIGYGLM